MILLCLLKTIVRSLQIGWPMNFPMSGHDFANEEEDVPALVTTSRCENCDRYEVNWRKLGRLSENTGEERRV